MLRLKEVLLETCSWLISFGDVWYSLGLPVFDGLQTQNMRPMKLHTVNACAWQIIISSITNIDMNFGLWRYVCLSERGCPQLGT